MPKPRATDRELLTALLKQVSRSFYLTLRILPARIRPPISLAYLLARATDTLADTEIVPLALRLEALQKLRERISGASGDRLNFGQLARQQVSPAERILLERIEDSLALLGALRPEDLKLVREVLHIITGGQELDLRRFAEASAAKIIALHTDSELDDYTYRVAGCVGEFWTRICAAHLSSFAKQEESESDGDFEELGVRFGKGLQLVNILRDLPVDLRLGRCYLPADQLAEAGLVPADLLSPANESRVRPLYHQYLDLAGAQLAAGWQYTNQIPFNQMRVRLACAWPLLIGVETLRRLRLSNVLDPGQRVKVSRSAVRGILLRSVMLYPWPPAWRGLFRRPGSGVGKAVASRTDLP